MFSRCAVLGCNNSDIEIHHERKLARRYEEGNKTTILNRRGRRIRGLSALMSAMNRKQLPLCKKHHLEFDSGKPSELDSEYLRDLLKTNVPDGLALIEAFNKGRLETFSRRNDEPSSS